MVNVVDPPPVRAVPVWMVHLQLGFIAAGRPPASEDELEPMVELMTRTAGVCSAAVVPLQSGLAVAAAISARDAETALDRAMALAFVCARYAGLGKVTVRRVRVVPEPDAGRA